MASLESPERTGKSILAKATRHSILIAYKKRSKLKVLPLSLSTSVCLYNGISTGYFLELSSLKLVLIYSLDIYSLEISVLVCVFSGETMILPPFVKVENDLSAGQRASLTFAVRLHYCKKSLHVLSGHRLHFGKSASFFGDGKGAAKKTGITRQAGREGEVMNPPPSRNDSPRFISQAKRTNSTALARRPGSHRSARAHLSMQTKQRGG